MISLKQIIKKGLLLTLSLGVIIVIVTSSWVYYNQDKIIQNFLAEANKHLLTKVDVESISIDLWSSFPDVAIALHQVNVKGSITTKHPLLKAERINLDFDFFTVIRGDYTIKGVNLLNGFVNLYINDSGENNYTITKKNSSKSNLSFELSNVRTSDFEMFYTNDSRGTYLDLESSSAFTKIISESNNFYVDFDGDVFVRKIKSHNQEFLTDKLLDIESKLEYNEEFKSLEIRPSRVFINKSAFQIYGNYKFKDSSDIELFLEGKDANLQTITELLPSKISNSLKKYRSKGDAYFDLSLKGSFSRNKGPALSVQFGLDDAEIYYPETKISITQAHTTGLLELPNIYQSSIGTLELNDLSGYLENQAFSGQLHINGFKDPLLNLSFTGVLDVESVLKFYSPQKLNNASGSFEIDLSFEGRLSHLKSKDLTRKIKTEGQVSFLDITMETSALKFPIKELNGTLLFNDNDIALNQITGLYGSSDFELDGFFKNVLAYLLLENEPLGIEASLKSKFISLNELLSYEGSSNESYTFKLNPKLRLKFNCHVERILFRRFNAKSIKGQIIIKDQKLNTPNLEFKSMGGKIALSGQVNASLANNIQTTSELNLNGVDIDSVFYVFENFDQSFLRDKNLKGNINASISSTMIFDSLLNLDQQSLKSTISSRITGGRLLNFEPLQRIEKYVGEENLDQVEFAELNSDIAISDRTIYFPPIEIFTNVTNLKISGTHTFNQEIDYKVVTPLRQNRRIDKDAAFGAIEENSTGQSLLYLKITGTTDDYKVTYDTDEVKKKIVADIKKEIEELKSAIKNNGLKQKKTIELSEEDYFDWEEEP